jgi:hypothetical protein
MLEQCLASSVIAAMWSNRVEDGYLRLQMPDSDRSALLTRFAYLDDAFMQQPEEEPIREMLRFFPGAKPTSQAYLYVMRQTIPAPSWAVADACMRARRGELKEKTWAPIPSLLRALAWDIALPYWRERARLARILAARDPRPAESAERRKHVAERILAQVRERMFAGKAKNPQG